MGQTHMFAKMAGLVTLFDVRGEELNQGAMLRYLSEMIWFPIAFLGDNISWQEIDEHSAQVTFHDSGTNVWAKCTLIERDVQRTLQLTAIEKLTANFLLIPGLHRRQATLSEKV